MTSNRDSSEIGVEETITVTINDFEDAREAGKRTQNELYSRGLNEGPNTFEITVRSVDGETDRAKEGK